MTLIEQIKADREAGAEGPFCRTPGTGEIATHGGDYVARAIQADTPWGSANADRIARLDQLEAALLAADELAEVVEAMLRMMDDVIKGSGKGDMAIKPDGSMGVIDGWKRLAAYRRAIAGGEA